jgi:hypothetical protein
MSYKSYSVYYACQGSPDYLAEMTVPTSLIEKYGHEGDIIIGGGFNGTYILGRTSLEDEDGEWLGFDETEYGGGIDDIVDLINEIQLRMGHDGGGFIYKKFLESLREKATPEDFKEVIESLAYPIQEYSGGPKTTVEEFLKKKTA